jgi:hypothetical protein
MSEPPQFAGVDLKPYQKHEQHQANLAETVEIAEAGQRE